MNKSCFLFSGLLAFAFTNCLESFAGEPDAKGMCAYTVKLKDTKVQFEMMPIPGGVFKMGSPKKELGRMDDEGPQFKVRVEPFWMGKHEVTWNEYNVFKIV